MGKCTRHADSPGAGSGGGHTNRVLTLNLSLTESLNYAALRTELRAVATRHARRTNRRFAQIVAADGRIVDVLEVR